jgi:hypothetical protein
MCPVLVTTDTSVTVRHNARYLNSPYCRAARICSEYKKENIFSFENQPTPHVSNVEMKAHGVSWQWVSVTSLSAGRIAGRNVWNFNFFVYYLTLKSLCLFVILITLQSINLFMKITPLLRRLDTRNDTQFDFHDTALPEVHHM